MMMMRLRKALRRFRRNDEGVTLVEYGIALTLGVVVGTFLLTELGGAVQDEMTQARDVLAANDGGGTATGTGTAT